MEQQEETTEKIHRRHRGRQSSSMSKSTLSFPLDLILEILLKLPAKSVCRFRCVSKLWSSITTDRYFTDSFKTRSSTRPSLLLCFQKDGKMFVFSIPQHQKAWNESYTSSKPIDRYHMKFPEEYRDFSPTESVHGLICFEHSETPMVWNPSVRQLLSLTKPEKSLKGKTCFLGYDPIEGKHKVVCMPFDKTFDECWVLTLESTQKSWRRIKTNHKHRSFVFTYGRCINGIIYYQAHINDSSVLAIRSFDVRSEKFGMMIKLPSDISVCELIPYQGKLHCFYDNTMNNGMTLLILEDAEKHEWLCKHFLAPLLHYDQSLVRLDGITHAGEFIYVPYGFYKSFFILFYDPEKNSLRKVEFKGNADDEFRLRNRVGDGGINALHTFQDHIESLKSL